LNYRCPAAFVAVLSIQPVQNLDSPRQIMNTAFDRFDLVNTYGAFGTVGRERMKRGLRGTDDDDLERAQWKPYPCRALPVALDARPVVVAPISRASIGRCGSPRWGRPWNVPGRSTSSGSSSTAIPSAISLFAGNPFPGRPPRYVRAVLYRYAFARPGDPDGRWWTREELGTCLRPLSADDPQRIGALKMLRVAPGARCPAVKTIARSD
jgi:hypothetical protein